MGLPSTAAFTLARLSALNTTPVGLQGELMTMALVLGVMTASRASLVI
jgi:hypothetical protein